MNKPPSFWNKAAQSLPAPYQARYRALFERAERWELAYDGVIELFTRIKSAPSHKGLTTT